MTKTDLLNAVIEAKMHEILRYNYDAKALIEDLKYNSILLACGFYTEVCNRDFKFIANYPEDEFENMIIPLSQVKEFFKNTINNIYYNAQINAQLEG